jgi:hypothetical protein
LAAAGDAPIALEQYFFGLDEARLGLRADIRTVDTEAGPVDAPSAVPQFEGLARVGGSLAQGRGDPQSRSVALGLEILPRDDTLPRAEIETVAVQVALLPLVRVMPRGDGPEKREPNSGEKLVVSSSDRCSLRSPWHRRM